MYSMSTTIQFYFTFYKTRNNVNSTYLAVLAFINRIIVSAKNSVQTMEISMNILFLFLSILLLGYIGIHIKIFHLFHFSLPSFHKKFSHFVYHFRIYWAPVT